MKTFFIFLICIIFLAGVYWLFPWIICRIWKIKCKKNAKCFELTFDDGPGFINTPKVLNILSLYNVKASFYLLGRNVKKNPDLVKRIKNEGHEICSHGYEHLNYWKVWPWYCISDLCKGQKAINDALGVVNKCYPFRPPYGKLNVVVLVYLLIKGIPVRFWSFVSGDTMYKLPEVNIRLEALLKEKKGVVLLHDFDREDVKRNQFVIQFSEKILQLKSQNLKMDERQKDGNLCIKE
jgi:peptidoglycan/xylan/chitin deacetylase (PgdA/CDA1 family)